MRHRPFEACPCCAPGAASRREVLRASLGLGAAALGCGAVAAPEASAQPAFGGARRLSVKRAYTDDAFDGVYWRDGRYVREALARLDYVFRDLSAEEVTPMDPRLFDVLHDVARRLDADEPYSVISGYRSPETNASLRGRSRNVSTVSLHMSGMAADVRLTGRDSLGMARTAVTMGRGGVGLYRRDGFVHLDCGQPRRW